MDSPDGCMKCFCNDQTINCTSAGYNIYKVDIFINRSSILRLKFFMTFRKLLLRMILNL